ncbi:protein FAM200A-like [Macrobrachium rosenbergii]|uniref:protein FAM200A-like n=1 Tax=Macrobrachium rosenbergii TaxID=79674 RepID=UPI0034D6FAB9
MLQYLKRKHPIDEEDQESENDSQPSTSKEEKEQRKFFGKKVTVSEKAQEASYLVAELVAKKMKSHTIAEGLIMLAFKIIVKTMVGEEAVREISKVPVSDTTVSRRVDDMSRNISDILSEILKHTKFALQVDESTGIMGKEQLLAFVRFDNREIFSL